MAEELRDCIILDEEVEGDRDGTSDILFCRIGSAVPLKGSDFGFDLSNPPARPLAVSEKFGLLFLAHTAGFLVVKTIDVIGLAKAVNEIEEGNGNKRDMERLCIQEKSILDAQMGGVHILAISRDSSVLAAAVDREIRFFSISLLINKGQEPVLTCSIGESDRIKNFLWRKNMETSFVVLSTCGILYHGNLKSDLKDIMDGVEAVDWSEEGNFLAVARNNGLTIMSSEFKQQLNMSLLFDSWKSDTDSKFTVKVDSIKWVRSDSIVIGCVQINDNDEEVDYMVQVITTEGAGIPEAGSKPVVVTFSDLFHGIVDDIVPTGGGPNLLMGYMETWDLGIVANRKNTDDHIVLLSWPADGKRPVALEFEQEKFIPRIELQENREENLLLGIDIDRVSMHEKLELKIDSEVKALSSHCILLCLSCEGKLIMFNIARISEPVCSCASSFKPPEDIVGAKENCPVVSPLADDTTLPSTGLEGKEFKSLGGVQSSIVKEQTAVKALPSVPAVMNQMPVPSPFRQAISLASENSIKSGSEVNQFSFSGISRSASSSMGSMLSETSVTSHSSKVSRRHETVPTVTHANNMPLSLFGSQSTEKPCASRDLSAKSSLLCSNRSIAVDSPESGGIQRHGISQKFSNSIQPSIKFSKDSVGFTSSSNGSKALLRPGYNEPAPAIHISPASSKENSIPGKSLASNFQNVLSSNRVSGSPVLQESEPTLSKQFYSVNEMAKELDALLADIEQQGGFRDACTVAQRSLVLSLEEGLKKVPAKLRNCKGKVEEHLQQIQQLQDKRMQVSMRQIYMRGLVTQASDGQYWDIWNSQKLGPEFEVKQQRISKLNHALVNELVELERHFNALELKKYGDSGAAPKGRRALLGSLGTSRQVYSLHSLYNTVNSQLAAAEKLSECLSKQMSVLNINSPSSKRRSMTKELLESIGLDYDADSFQSPDPKSAAYSPDSSKKSLFLSSSRQTKEHTKRSTLSTLKTSEPESSRRRRDSLDRSWTKFDPPKTIVKRMLQDEHFKVGMEESLSTDKEVSILPSSEGFPASQKRQEVLSPSSSQSSINKFQFRFEKFNKDDQNKLPKQLSEYQTSPLFKWTKELSQASKDVQGFPSSSEMQTSTIQSTPVAMPSSLPMDIQSKMEELGALADSSKYKQESIVMHSDSSVETNSLAKARFSAQFDALLQNHTSFEASTSLFPSKIAPSVKAVQASGSLNVKRGEDGPRKASKGSMDQVINPEHSTSLLEKRPPSLLSTMSGNVSQIKAATSRSQLFDASSGASVSFAMVPSLSDQSSAAASVSFLSVTTSSSESPGSSSIKHFEGSSPITVSSVILSQSSLPSISSVAPVAPVRSSSTPFQPQISKTLAPVSSPSKDVTSQSPLVTSQPSIAVLQPEAPEESEPIEVTSKSRPTLLPRSEASARLVGDTKSSLLNSAVSPASSASQSLPEILIGSSKLSSAPKEEKDEVLIADKKSSLLNSAVSVSSSTSHSLSKSSFGSSNLPSIPAKRKDEGLDITITGEDEMEEEAPEANAALNLSDFSGFALEPSTVPSPPKINPFGGPLIANATTPSSASVSLETPTEEVFRPASFNLPSPQPMQTSQPMNSGLLSGLCGFGQPAQIGAGQHALGSVLGSFGQSRQLGVSAQGSGFGSSGGSGEGGFSPAAMSGGGAFAGAAAAGGGYSAVGLSSSGFAGVAGGGFAAMASKPGGFAAAASAGTGFGGSSGSGFTSGGFGLYAPKQDVGGFSQFGGTNTAQTGKPPAELLMQMRK